ncbi:MAG TPA: GerMN domain-containing protein [Anaerolineales bacterium]|nr:GerMN domain-containing protein [Anaerolineales bacterium]
MKTKKLLMLFMMVPLAACGQFNVSVEPLQTAVPTNTIGMATNTAVAASPTVQVIDPTATVVVPSATLVVPATTQVQQVPPTSTSVPPTSVTTAEQMVKIVLIELEGNGQSGPLVGCGDSAIPINVVIPPTQGVLRAALEKLFSAKQQFYGESGYYNSLYQSDLEIASVRIEQGNAIIHLTGTIMLGGVCDAPRVEAQIEQTALQFSTVSNVTVFVNDVPLEDALSSQ